MLQRIEINAETGEVVGVEQRAWRVGDRVVVADASEQPSEGVLMTDDELAEARSDQPTTVRVVSMRQARLALLSMGLLDDVETAIGMLPEPQKSAAKIEWEYAAEVRSDNPTVMLLAGEIGLDLEQLFDIAEGIQ